MSHAARVLSVLREPPVLSCLEVLMGTCFLCLGPSHCLHPAHLADGAPLHPAPHGDSESRLTQPPGWGPHIALIHSFVHARGAMEARTVWRKKAILLKRMKTSTLTGSTQVEKPAPRLDEEGCGFPRVMRAPAEDERGGGSPHSALVGLCPFPPLTLASVMTIAGVLMPP